MKKIFASQIYQREESFPSSGQEEITSLPPPSKKTIIGKIVLIIFGVFIALFLVMGSLLATRIWDPLWNPFRPSPEKVMEKTIFNMTKKLNSFFVSTALRIQGEDEKKRIKISFDSMVDTKLDNLKALDKKDIDFSSVFDNSISFKTKGFQADASGTGEIRKKGKNYYFKLNDLTFPFVDLLKDEPSSSLVSVINLFLENIKNKWIKIDSEEFFEQGEDQGIIGKEEWSEFKTFWESLTRNSGGKLYIIKKELPDQKINNIKVYHYVLGINENEYERILEEINKKIEEKTGKGFLESKETEKRMKELEDFSFEVWIGKKDNMLYRIKLNQKIEYLEESPGIFNFNLEANFSDFNKPMIIEEPKEAKSVKELIAPFLGTFEK